MTSFGMPLPPPSADQERLARACWALTRWAVTNEDLDDPRWARVADALEALVAETGPVDAGASRYPTDPAAARLGDGATANARGTHPLFGTAHPLAPPIRLVEVSEGGVVADVTFDGRFEGIRGCVHGGFIAAGFDFVCGMAMASAITGGGPTGTLTVRYRALTPIGVELRYTARVDRVEGRKIFVLSRLATVADDRTTAEAETIFVAAR